MKFVFTPFSILLGLAAGLVGQKIFEKIWGLVDDEEPPSPQHREFSWPKLVAALLVWFWISNLAILFGHQLNAERERSLELAEGRPRAAREIQLEPRDEPKQQQTT